jgi:polyhydroxyalkanoate synthesis regulator phasin
MVSKAGLFTSYQNALNLSDVNIEDYLFQRTHLSYVKLKTLASSISLVNRLLNEGKMDAAKAKAFIEDQKESIRVSLAEEQPENSLDVEETIAFAIGNNTLA